MTTTTMMMLLLRLPIDWMNECIWKEFVFHCMGWVVGWLVGWLVFSINDEARRTRMKIVDELFMRRQCVRCALSRWWWWWKDESTYERRKKARKKGRKKGRADGPCRQLFAVCDDGGGCNDDDDDDEGRQGRVSTTTVVELPIDWARP